MRLGDVTRDVLRESEIRYRRLFETARDGILLLNADTGQIEDVNPCLIEMLGYSHAEFLGKKLWEVGTFADTPQSKEMFLKLQSEGYVRYDDLPLKARAGGKIEVEFVSNSYDVEGTKVIQCNIRNISARKLAESTVAREKHFTREAPDSLPGLFYCINDEGQFLRRNRNFESVLGYAPEEISRLKPAALFAESEQAAPAKQIKQVFLAGQATLEADLVAKTQTATPYLFTGVRELEGKPCLVGMGTEITERKRSDARIKHLNRICAVLSGISSLIMRAHSRDELFTESCRIAVEKGAFRMAWIGMIDPQTLDAKVVAWFGGDPGYVDKIRVTVREGTPDSDRPACRALRLLKPVICNNIATEATLATLRDELLARGHKSVGCFPLTTMGQPEGVLVLFADECNVFDDEEIRLLLELAGNITFALDHIRNAERIDHLKKYDDLTGLPNRSLFHERLRQSVATAREHDQKLGLVIVDVERFKAINDTLGEQAGDAVLKELAARMSASTKDVHRLARVGSDHFAVFVPELETEEQLARVVEQRFALLFDSQFQVGHSALSISAKAGIAVFPTDGSNVDSLFKNAEAALRNAKASGERYMFYTPIMNARVASRLSLENQLREALIRGEFVLHYQPRVNSESGRVTGAEALIRWNNPITGRMIPPNDFIPILEESGMIHDVGRWAKRKAIEDYLRWRDAGLPVVRISVNVSPLQLHNRDFVNDIVHATGVDTDAAAGLELEITEGVFMRDIDRNIASLQAIRSMGVTIAIDDFGTGFSSLSYLARLPVDRLKIDRSFVNNMTAGPEGLALVSTIINLAHALKMNVVAEGVETEEQSRILRLLGCDEMQGFLFSKAVPGDIFETEFLRHFEKATSYIASGASSDVVHSRRHSEYSAREGRGRVHGSPPAH